MRRILPTSLLALTVVASFLAATTSTIHAGNPIPRVPCAVYLQGYLHELSKPSKTNEGSTVPLGGATWNFAKQAFFLSGRPVAEIVPLIRQVPPAAGKTCAQLTNLDRKVSVGSPMTIPTSGAFTITYTSNGMGEQMRFMATTPQTPSQPTPPPAPVPAPSTPTPTPAPSQPTVINIPPSKPQFPAPTPAPIRKMKPATTKITGQVVNEAKIGVASATVSLLAGISNDQLKGLVGKPVTAFVDRTFSDRASTGLQTRQIFPKVDGSAEKEWVDPSLCPTGMTLIACLPPLAGNLVATKGTLKQASDGLPTIPTNALQACMGVPRRCFSLFQNVLVNNALQQLAKTKQYPAPYYILSEGKGFGDQKIYTLTWLKPSDESVLSTVTTDPKGSFSFSDVPVLATHVRTGTIEQFISPTPAHPADGVTLTLSTAKVIPAAPAVTTPTVTKPFKTEGTYTSAALSVPAGAKPFRLAVAGLKRPEGTSVDIAIAIDGKLDTLYPAPTIPTVCAQELSVDCANKTFFDLSDTAFASAKTLTIRFTMKGTEAATPTLSGFSIWYAPASNTSTAPSNAAALAFTLDHVADAAAIPTYEIGVPINYSLANPLAAPVNLNLSCGLQAGVYAVRTDAASQQSVEEVVYTPTSCWRAIANRSPKKELAPGETVTGTWNQTTNAAQKVIQPGIYRLRIATDRGDVTQDVEIVPKR